MSVHIDLCNKKGEFLGKHHSIIVDVVPRVGDVVQYLHSDPDEASRIVEATVVRVQHNVFHEQERANNSHTRSGTNARVYVFLDVG